MTASSRAAAAAILTLCPALILCCALLAAPPAAAQATQPYRPILLAHGSSNRYWVANVESWKDGQKFRQKTVIRGQVLPAGDWQEVITLYQPALDLTDLQGDLAILLEDGNWKRAGPAGLSTGPALPGVGPVLAWGSSSNTLYAVRAVEGGREALTTRPNESPAPPAPPATRPTTAPTTQATLTTRPATSPVAAATRPTTRPAPLVLLQYDRGQWVAVADLPPDLPAHQMALTVTGDRPLLATSADGTTIRTLAWSDGRWQDWGEVRPPTRAARFELLTVPNVLALWTIDLDGVIRVNVKREGESWAPLKEFKMPDGVPADAQRTLALAGEEFRLEVLKDGKISEQRYDLSGAKRGSLTELPTPQSTQPSPLGWILQSIALLVMVVVLITFYRRRAAQPPAADDDESNR
jgi:hypothetical protein